MATESKPARKMGNDALGRERRMDLKNRILAVRAWSIGDDEVDPPAVAAARKLVNAHDQRRHRAKTEKREATQHAQRLAQSRLLATDSYEEGTKIVEAFEREARKRGWVKKENT